MIVKEKSIIEFFRNHVIGFEELKQDQHYNPYYLMQDQLFVRGLKFTNKKDEFVVEFVISDKAKNTHTMLTNYYQYTLLSYDDVSDVLQLSDYKVEISDITK